MTDTTVTCPVGETLFDDWVTRGLFGTPDEQARSLTFRKQGRRVWITTSRSILLGLVDDANWLCDPSMGQAPSIRATCRRFVNEAQTRLDAGQIMPYTWFVGREAQ